MNYYIYGLCLKSNVPLPELQTDYRNSPDVILEWQPPGEVPKHPRVQHTIHESKYKNGDLYYGVYKAARCYRPNNGEAFRADSVYIIKNQYAEFQIHIPQKRILCWPKEKNSHVDRHQLYSIVFPLLLHHHGIHIAHGSAIAAENGVVAFLGDSGVGKSVLVTSFVKEGYPLVTDDALPLTEKEYKIYAFPSYPQIKLTSESVADFFGKEAQLPWLFEGALKKSLQVGNGLGDFGLQPLPLHAIYLPEMHEGAENQRGVIDGETSKPSAQRMQKKVEIVHLDEIKAIKILMKKMNAVYFLEKEFDVKIFDFCLKVFQQVPIRRLIYPREMNLLPAVQKAVLEDIRAAGAVLSSNAVSSAQRSAPSACLC